MTINAGSFMARCYQIDVTRTRVTIAAISGATNGSAEPVSRPLYMLGASCHHAGRAEAAWEHAAAMVPSASGDFEHAHCVLAAPVLIRNSSVLICARQL